MQSRLKQSAQGSRYGRSLVGGTVALLAALVFAQVGAAGGTPWDLRVQDGHVQTASVGPTVDAVAAGDTLPGTLGWFFVIDDFDVSVTNPSLTVDSGYPTSVFTGLGASAFPVSVSQANLEPGQSWFPNAQFGVTTLPTTVTPGFDSSRSVSPLAIPVGGGEQEVTVSVTPRTTGPDFKVTVGDLPGVVVTTLVGPSNLNDGETLDQLPSEFDLNDAVAGKTYTFSFVDQVPNPYGVPWTHKPFVSVNGGAESISCCSGPTNSVVVADPTLDGGTPGRGQVTYTVDQTVDNWAIDNGAFTEIQYQPIDAAPAPSAPTLSVSPTTIIRGVSSFTASGSGVPGGSVALELDGTAQLASGIPVDASGNWSFTGSANVGAHSLTATQTVAGATSVASAPVTVQVLPPKPTISGPAMVGGSSSPVSFTLDGSGFYGAAQTPPSGATVTVFDGSSVLGSATVAANGQWVLPVQLAAGVHSLTSTQTLAGETSSVSAPFSVSVDVAQVILFTSSPPSPAQVGGTYTVSASGGGSGEPVGFGIDESSGNACTISGTTVSFEHVGTCVVDAKEAGGGGYLPAEAGQTIAVSKGDPTLSWSPPGQIAFGTPLGAAQLDASASVAGSFSYDPAAGTVLQPGTNALTATFTPSDAADWNGGALSTTLVVAFSQPCVSGRWSGPLVIAAGESVCVDPGAVVTGPVTVEAGGALWASGATVAGPLRSTGALALTLCGDTLTGPLSAAGSSGPVLVGDPASGCSGNTITGPVTLTRNGGGVTFSSNTVTGPVTISDDSGGVVVADNLISGPLVTSDDS